MILGIIPCSKEKIWDLEPQLGAVPAAQAYRSRFHLLAQHFVAKHADLWLIFSAKYGLMEPDFLISESYDITFSRPEDLCISALELQHQAQAYRHVAEVWSICPSLYGAKLELAFEPHGVEIHHPLRGVGGWGVMHRWLAERT